MSTTMDYRALRLGSIALFILIGVSCGHVSKSSDVSAKEPANVVKTRPISEKEASQEAKPLCDRVAEIKTFPMKGERNEDAVYDAVMDAGDKVVPCLIGKIADSTKVQTPLQQPRFPDIETCVGDIAYFLIIDITKLNFSALLPNDVRAKYAEEGVYAYFKFIKKSGNRKKLQSSLNEWYLRKYGKKL